MVTLQTTHEESHNILRSQRVRNPPLPADGVADVPLGGGSTEDDTALLIVTNAHDLAVAPGLGHDDLMPAAPQLEEHLRGETGFGHHASGEARRG